MKNKSILFDGMKAVDLWGDDLTGWTVLSGEGQDTADSEYYKLIPTLYRAVNIRGGAISSMPFELRQGKTVYDSSADWQNKVHFLPNPTKILYLIESALCLSGRAYIFREKAAINYQGQAATFNKLLRYHLPTSVTPIIDPLKGLEYFERQVNNQPKKFDVKDYVYFWPPDPTVETGPARNYPLKAAANACAVLMNMDIFADQFFARGAIKEMLLSVKGMPLESDRLKLKDWWTRVVSGVKNAFGAQVLNAESITPIVVGEGMKELENVTVGQEKREDISIAVGIPMSILFANAANYATSKQDELHFLNKTIIPECDFIAATLNEQLFDDLGLHWEFLPETLDAMQEDESERAAAMSAFMDALSKCDSFEMVEALFEIYGIEASDKAMLSIQKHYADKEKRAEEMAKQLAQKPEPVAPGQEPPEVPTMQQEGQGEAQDTKMAADIDKWKRKALNALKKGKSPAVEFESTTIPFYYSHQIATLLEAAKDEKDVKAAFVLDDDTVTYSNPMPLADYAELITTLREAIEKVNVDE